MKKLLVVYCMCLGMVFGLVTNALAAKTFKNTNGSFLKAKEEWIN